MNLNKIEEKLILEDWKFKSSHTETKKEVPKNSKDIFAIYNAETSRPYESRTYEYVGYLNDITTIRITDYEDDDQNDVEIISENNRLYKNVLEDLVQAGFEVSNEKSPYVGYYLGDYNIGELVTLESNGKIYRYGNHEVHLIIYRKAKVTRKNDSKGTFSYDENSVIDEYQVIVK